MSVLTRHPAAPPPTAPVREKTSHLMLRGWCIFVLAAALGGTSWLMAGGLPLAAAVGIGSAVVSGIVWAVVRPVVHWQRLPWFAMLYLVWAVASLLWSAWPAASALTLTLLLLTTGQAFFVGAVLTWRELVRSLASAVKWVLGLSLLFEIAAWLFWDGGILPGFGTPTGNENAIELWSRENLVDGGRLQGLFGNANALAYVSLLGIFVFALRWVTRAPRRTLLIGWMLLSVFLFVRAGSATAVLAAGLAAAALVTMLLMRRANPARRAPLYAAYAAVALGGGLALWFGRDALFSALGRSADLTGRERIWDAVSARIAERPVLGWGYSTPWIPTDPAFDGWIVDHGQTVMQAHNMWLDVRLQLGIVGVILIALVLVAFAWRAWFFAVDRPRWDLVADRPYSPITLLPTLVAAMLLVQGVAESGPLLSWGWMLLVMFAFKIKQAPLLGRGPSEQRLAGEQGEGLTER